MRGSRDNILSRCEVFWSLNLITNGSTHTAKPPGNRWNDAFKCLFSGLESSYSIFKDTTQ